MIRGRRHDADLLAKMFDGENRQVWALEPDGTRFYLPENGVTSELRKRAKSGELRCPVPQCDSPQFQVCGGSVRRHHFAHVTAPSRRHNPETIFHVQAKAALVAWATAHHPDAEVVEEFHFEGGERVADVLVTFPSGAQVAFEVQYSDLKIHGPRGWGERHRWYADRGISDVWLFAPRGQHLRTEVATPSPDVLHVQARLPALQKHLAGEQHPIVWFHPASKEIITPIVQGDRPEDVPDWWRPERLESVGPRRPRSHDAQVDLRVDELDECILTPAGIVTPTDEWLAGERDKLSQKAKEAEEEFNRELERRNAARAAAREAKAAVAKQDISRAEPTPQVPVRPVRSFLDVKLWHTRPLPAWDERNPDWQWLTAWHGNELPAVLTEPHPCEHGIGAPLLQWRTAIYRHLVNLANQSCCEGDAIEALFQLGPAHDPALLHRAATDFHRAIRRAGLVR